jgi:hypothetical protein
LLRFFRINDPYRLLAAFLLLLILWVVYALTSDVLSLPQLKWLLIGERLTGGFVMYRDLYDYTGPLSAFVYRALDALFGRSVWAHYVVVYLVICINATILNLQLVRNKAYEENTYLPGLLYVLLAFSIPDNGALSPMLMSSTFVLLALNNVFKRVDNQSSDDLFLNTGIFLGIAILFYLPAITYFFILLISLMIFSSAIPRRLLLYFYGLTVPLVLTVFYYYWFDSFDYLLEQYISQGLTLPRLFYLSWTSFFGIAGVLIFWLVISLFQVIIRGRFGNYESKVIQIMLLVLVAASFSVWLDVSLQPAHLHLFTPVIAFYITHYVLKINRRIPKVVLPWLLILSLIAAKWALPLVIDQGDINLTKSTLSLSDTKAMVLSKSYLIHYQGYQVSGPFFEPTISSRHMTYLDFYESSYQIYEAIDRDRPEIIIDELGLVPRIFKRFPVLSLKYEQQSPSRYVLINN